MVAVLKHVAASLDGEFLVVARWGQHFLTATEEGLANALFVARQLSRDGWEARVQGQEDRNRAHDYTYRAFKP